MNYNDEFLRLVAKRVETHGVNAQLNMVKEELAELIVAISHLERNRKSGEWDVFIELADVEFMLAQLKYILQRDYGYEPSRFEWQKYFTAGIPLTAHELECNESEARNE